MVPVTDGIIVTLPPLKRNKNHKFFISASNWVALEFHNSLNRIAASNKKNFAVSHTTSLEVEHFWILVIFVLKWHWFSLVCLFSHSLLLISILIDSIVTKKFLCLGSSCTDIRVLRSWNHSAWNVLPYWQSAPWGWT